MTPNANYENPEAIRQHSHLSDVRIVIADNHPVVRVGIRNMLAGEPSIHVVGEAGDGEEAIEQTLRLSPDILLLDQAMPRLPGLETIRQISLDNPTIKIIFLASDISAQQSLEALQNGVRGILMKNTFTGHMTEAILSVALGDYWVRGKRVVNLDDTLRELERQAAKPECQTYGLTPREMEVVACIVKGCSNRVIAQRFHLSEETVKRHLSNIFDKTGVSTRLELALFAIAHRMVDPKA